MRSTKEIGMDAENHVIDYMEKHGYKLITRNFLVPGRGEIDSFFEKAGEYYVVEVRSRLNKGPFPESAETITFQKRKKLFAATAVLISKYNLYDKNINFLVGQVTHNINGLVQNVEILPF